MICKKLFCSKFRDIPKKKKKCTKGENGNFKALCFTSKCKKYTSIGLSKQAAKDKKNFIYPKSQENNQNKIQHNESTNG